MSLNTSNFVAGQASTLSVDGTIFPNTGSTGILCAIVYLRFDPAKLTISNVQWNTAAGWSEVTINTVGASQGWVAMVALNGNYWGQTASGPMLTFTATPANSTVNVNDCATLKLGTESGLCDDLMDSYYPTDPCNGLQFPLGQDPFGLAGGLSGDGDEGSTDPIQRSSLLPIGGEPDFMGAARALRIVGGLMASNPDDVPFMDYTGDSKITVADAVAVLRAPVSGPPRAFELGFQDALSTNMPAVGYIDGDTRVDVVFTSDDQDPARYYTNPDHPANPNDVYAITDTTGSGNFGLKIGWPQPMRDGPAGLSLADINGDGAVDVLATNFQDVLDNDDDPAHNDPDFNLQSRLYVWTNVGGGIEPLTNGHYLFAMDSDPDNMTGLGVGHSYACPVVMPTSATGNPTIFYTYQGHNNQNLGWYQDGGMQMLKVVTDAQTHVTSVQTTRTQSSSASDPWYTSPHGDSLFGSSPTFPVCADGARSVVLAAESGLVYRWNFAGQASANWFPAANAVTRPDSFSGIGGTAEPAHIKRPPISANLDGLPGDEVLVGTGDVFNYWGFFLYPYHTMDGAVFCWGPTGNLAWRYPAFKPGFQIQDFGPTITTGISVGRLLGDAGPLCAVFGNAAGEVVALNNNGQFLWKFTALPKPVHPAYCLMNTQPLILDINNDGYQDVIVGSSNGYVYALNGLNGHELWHAVTYPAFDTTLGNVTESHYEEVKGLAATNMDARDPTRLTLVVTSGVVQDGEDIIGVPDPRQGHVMVLEAGPNTFNPQRADWPQFQRNARRTGVYPGP